MITRYGARFVLVVLCLCAGCKGYDYGFDNPGVRALQAESFVGLPPSFVAGESLDSFFGPRTEWILRSSSALAKGESLQGGQVVNLGGRAAAVSTDGYYLTASHNVKDDDPVLVLPPGSRSPSGKPISLGNATAVMVPGKVVRFFPPADLALIKFDHQPRAYFTNLLINPKPGIDVYTGATMGYVLGNERIGNGPFRVRGEILKVKPVGRGSNATRVFTSITARGGMSGAPIADGYGNLIGILGTGIYSGLTNRPQGSNWDMVPAEEIISAIENHRQLTGVD